ncbi:MAG: DUF4132 domain-containing protein [Saprospiraceae bacterium]|nr:DUF4132 domain-containing protein [Saprospiraceae bacterium]
MAITDLLSRWLQVGEQKEKLPDHPLYNEFILPLLRTAKKESFSYYNRPFVWSGDPTYERLKKIDPATKKEFVFWLVKDIRLLNKKRLKNKNLNSTHPVSVRQAVEEELLKLLLKSSLPFSLDEIVELFTQFKKKENLYGIGIGDWPMGWATKQLERAAKRESMNAGHIAFFTAYLSLPVFLHLRSYHYGSDLNKVKIKIEKVLHEASGYEATVPPVYLSEEDEFGKFINHYIADLPLEKKGPFYRLLDLVRDVNGGKPGRKFEKQSQAIIGEIGKRAYRKWLKETLQFLIGLKETSQEHSYPHGIRIYTYTTTTYLYDSNNAVAKGLVWTLLAVQDKAGLQIIERLAVRAFKKIPQVGAAATAVGNACFYVLANAKGLEGLAQLSRLRVKIKQNSAKKLIDKYLDQQSEARGTSRQELEEMAITDYGLVNGMLVFDFQDYQLKLTITGVGKTQLQWIKPDGKLQKSVPAFVKQGARWKKKLKDAKLTNKSIQQALSLERDKLDRSFLENRSWTFERFQQLFVEHGLLSYLGKRLIWTFNLPGQSKNAMWREGEWRNAAGEKLEGLEDATTVRLWHPVFSQTQEVQQWRDQMQTWQITQPMKQAFREIYLLTDAEVNTSTYSNRMAGHLIKQHQFNALASTRDWRYTLVGAWDHGTDCVARKKLPNYKMTAEFWCIELTDSDDYTDSGIWTYVGTDQVRFVTEYNEVIPLESVPPLVLTEVMRDVDLFVGVGSVGNDPAWQDNGGLPQYRNYWQEYSFGDLRETAKVRKQTLERILPMLKIRDVASIRGKFLVIKGKIRTYKIHIGSTNILMEPNDQYLCIVAARGKASQAEKVFLPFEGDRGFSILLSKAFMLAEDEKITDPTITSQLRLRVF